MKFYVNIKGVSNKKIEKRAYLTEDLDWPLVAGVVNDDLVGESRILVFRVLVQDFLKVMIKSEKSRQDEKLKEDDKFREVFPVKAESLEKATDNALQSFQDGLIALFVDDKKYEKLEDEIELHEGSEVTFVRLTFLAGRMW